MATVQTEGGRPEKVLIEVQKAWDKDDMMRFRKYLGEQYGKKESVNGRETTLPITTIYILGFNLDGMESPCVKVGRTYMDMRNRETIHAKSDFIEMLTHDSYVIQASRITDVRYTTNLDKLLSIFEQAYFVKDNSGVVKEYPYQPDDENMDIITSVLYGMAADPEARKRLEDEEETMRVLDVIYFSKIRERDKALEESDKALEEKNKALKEKDKVIEEKDKRIAELQRLLQNRPVE
jgi:hypothetical protein